MNKTLVALAATAVALAGGSAHAYVCANTDTIANAVECADGDPFNNNDSAGHVWVIAATYGWDLTYGFVAPLTQYKDDNVLASDIPPSTTPLFDAVRDPLKENVGLLTFTQALDAPFILALKGGDSWAAYVFDSDYGIGDTISFVIPGRTGNGLSHASIYVGAVPEPGTYALMLAGLGAVGLMVRRRTA